MDRQLDRSWRDGSMEPERCMEAEGGKPGRERPGHSERESIPRAYSSRNQEGARHRRRNKEKFKENQNSDSRKPFWGPDFWNMENTPIIYITFITRWITNSF